MSEFKTGDRVRVRGGARWAPAGAFGVVIEVWDDGDVSFRYEGTEEEYVCQPQYLTLLGPITERGTKVIKPKGYPFPGTVLGSFETLAGETRLVVESDAAPGLLHIFAPHQVEEV